MLLWLILAAALPGLAIAHAMLESSTPDIDSTLASLPPRIVLTFDENLTSDSSYSVQDAGGATVATGGLDTNDAKSLSGPMPALADGLYEVRWIAISSDDNFVERGSFKFTVELAAVTPPPPTLAPTPSASALALATPSASPIPSVAASPSPSATASPTPSAAGGTTGADTSTDVLIPIAVAGILVGVGLAWFLRRRPGA
jgi:methionine-rich copper-binding protein CopC